MASTPNGRMWSEPSTLFPGCRSIIQNIEASTGAAAFALNHISEAIQQQSGRTARVDSVIRQAAGAATKNLALSEQSREGAHGVQVASETLGGVIAAIGRLVGVSNFKA